jgi:hypothetical protein
LVAAGLMVGGQAYAADGVKLGLGGFYTGAYGSHFDTQDGAVEDADLDRSDVIKQNAEVHFAGEVVLDNGLSVGARVELEAQEDPDQTDQVFAYVSGGFGEFRIGNTGEALTQECFVAPSATQVNAGGMFGADSPGFYFNNIVGSGGGSGTNGTCYGIGGDATKMIYFSPTFGGFNFTASYAPNGDEDQNAGAGPRADVGGTTSDSNTPFQNSEIYSIGANFAQDFNGVNVRVGGGATWALDLEGDGFFIDEGNLDTQAEYRAHALVGFGLGDGTLTVGGAWSLRANVRDGTATALGGDGVTHVTAVNDDNDDEYFSAGVSYAIDAWAIGAGASWGELESTCPGNACSDDHETYLIDGGYALGPGIGVGAMVAYDEWDDGDGNDSEDYDAITAALGLSIGF